MTLRGFVVQSQYSHPLAKSLEKARQKHCFVFQNIRFGIRIEEIQIEYRTSPNRTEPGEICEMHLVIFLAKKYKPQYLSSTNHAKYVGELPGTTPFNTAWYDAI